MFSSQHLAAPLLHHFLVFGMNDIIGMPAYELFRRITHGCNGGVNEAKFPILYYKDYGERTFRQGFIEFLRPSFFSI
jgi:hypothetical protein